MKYIHILALLFLLPVGYAILNSTFEPVENVPFTRFEYDRLNSSTNSSILYYGSNSYADHNPTNPNVVLRICNDTLTTGSSIDIRYTDESQNLTGSLLYEPHPQITTLANFTTYYCADIDISLATTKSLYPGLLSIYVNDVSFDHEIDVTFNGSYEIGVRAFSFPRKYQFIFNAIYDHNDVFIVPDSNYLFMSLVDQNNLTRESTVTRRTGNLQFTGTLNGGDSVYVNGLKSLEIQPIAPCSNITTPGYYILNDSSFNRNETCFTITNLTNTVINFGDDLIDGDNLDNGSLTEARCPVLVRDSQNITFENLKTQQFYYGICIYNSTVNIIGSNVVTNTRGALVTNASYLEIYNVSFENSALEIDAFNNSIVNLSSVQLSSATLSTIFMDATMKTVLTQPPDPDNLSEGLDEMNQSVEIIKNDVDSWTHVRFKYDLPLPNGRGIENVSIWKFNGEFGTVYTFNNITNVTTNSSGWDNGTWQKLFTSVDTQNRLIYAQNLTNFSIFKIFAGESTAEQDVEVPVPTTSSDPQSGSSSGRGGSAAGAFEDVVAVDTVPTQLELNLTDNVTFMQGAIGFVSFSLENIGNFTANDVIINAEVPPQWQSSNVTVESIVPGEIVNDSFIIGAFAKAPPGRYKIPISVYSNDGEYLVTQKVLDVIIVPRGNVKRLRVIEYPPVVPLPPFTPVDISMLIANVGDIDLNNVVLEIDDSPCLENVAGENDIASGETKLLTYKFFTGSVGKCAVDVKFYDEARDLVGFVPLTLDITPELSDEAKQTRGILLVLLFIWTLFTVLVVGRRKHKMTKIVEDEGQIEL